MPRREITAIVIHCTGTANGVPLFRPARPGFSARTAAQVIDQWHGQRNPPFHRDPSWVSRFNPHFLHLGYHFVLDVPGLLESGRHVDEQGAHVLHHNRNTLGFCMTGTDRFSLSQWVELRRKVSSLLLEYPRAVVKGHRDYSPDLNGDGTIEPNEWIKICPGFDVTAWWLGGMQPPFDHLLVSA